MDRGAWQATVHGVTGVRHDLATKPPPLNKNSAITWHHKTCAAYLKELRTKRTLVNFQYLVLSQLSQYSSLGVLLVLEWDCPKHHRKLHIPGSTHESYKPSSPLSNPPSGKCLHTFPTAPRSTQSHHFTYNGILGSLWSFHTFSLWTQQNQDPRVKFYNDVSFQNMPLFHSFSWYCFLRVTWYVLQICLNRYIQIDWEKIESVFRFLYIPQILV